MKPFSIQNWRSASLNGARRANGAQINTKRRILTD
jgi:hypothetical protein